MIGTAHRRIDTYRTPYRHLVDGYQVCFIQFITPDVVRVTPPNPMGNDEQNRIDNWSFTRLSPPGEGGIGIFYVTGAEAERVLNRVFFPAAGETKWTEKALQYGWLMENGESIDEVVVRFVSADQSLTGQPAAELNTHSGPAILSRITSLLESLGGTRIDPDTFLQRAERNGALDRLQRQAYEALLEVETRQGAAMLSNQLRGALSRSVDDLLKHLTAHQPDAEERGSIRSRLRQLIKLGKSGVAITDPRELCILGPPNAGKSTLMNALSQRKTSIVHEEAGTTRDVVHDTVFALGYPFRVRDTAGLRASGDRIERAGIEKAREMAEDADLVLWVAETLEEATNPPSFVDDDHVILIRNKEDLQSDPAYGVSVQDGTELVRISAEEEEGIQALREHIIRILQLEEELPVDAPVPFREEHLQVLERALDCCESGNNSKAAGLVSALLDSDDE